MHHACGIFLAARMRKKRQRKHQTPIGDLLPDG